MAKSNFSTLERKLQKHKYSGQRNAWPLKWEKRVQINHLLNKKKQSLSLFSLAQKSEFLRIFESSEIKHKTKSQNQNRWEEERTSLVKRDSTGGTQVATLDILHPVDTRRHLGRTPRKGTLLKDTLRLGTLLNLDTGTRPLGTRRPGGIRLRITLVALPIQVTDPAWAPCSQAERPWPQPPTAPTNYPTAITAATGCTAVVTACTAAMVTATTASSSTTATATTGNLNTTGSSASTGSLEASTTACLAGSIMGCLAGSITACLAGSTMGSRSGSK